MSTPDISKEAIAVVRRNTEEVQGKGNWPLFEELFADNFVDHTPQPGVGAGHPRDPRNADRPRDGPTRPSAARPAHLRDGPLQFPLRLLHAARCVRQGLPIPATQRAADLRRDRAAGRDIRCAWRRENPADGRVRRKIFRLKIRRQRRDDREACLRIPPEWY